MRKIALSLRNPLNAFAVAFQGHLDFVHLVNANPLSIFKARVLRFDSLAVLSCC
ncbi:hypothetical protein C8R31_10279 [Nitrosospira sp. Nsp2]|nr:hypothetical protein C8R31_10279 [Nitrosospira sp. Nsp2]